MTFSCFKNRPFLLNDLSCDHLAQAIKKAAVKHSFELWAYVFMPNHVHLLIYPETNKYSISKILATIKQPVSRKIINYLKKYNPDELRPMSAGKKAGPYRFWQDGGGYDRNIVSCTVLVNAINYIHNNPVKKGLVNKPSDYYWSSAKDWDGIGRGPIEVNRGFVHF